ncbi:hypothetical protein JCM5296_007482 [Sporobolomyces johnsonii]
MSDQAQPSKGQQLMASFRNGLDKLPAVSSIPHTLRQQAVPLTYHHMETLQLQLLIKSLSGVRADYDALARETARASKQLFLWSKDDRDADITDVGDRAAFLIYKTSELEQEAAAKIEQSRAPLKDIRNFENDLATRRKNRTILAARIDGLKGKKNNADQVQQLTAELAQVDQENATFESSFDTLKRTKLHETFSLQFAAQKELGEKIAIVAGYGELLLQGMETDGIGAEYKGQDRTARVKAELEEALLNWQPRAPPRLSESGSSLQRSDTRSFGATHADKLSQLDNGSTSSPSQSPASTSSAATSSLSHPGNHVRFVPPLPSIPGTPVDPSAHPPTGHGIQLHDRPVPPPPSQSHAVPSPSHSHSLAPPSPPGPALNLAPTPQDLGVDFSPPLTASHAIPHAPPGVEPPEPTVAETGAPKVGTGGPSSGQLRPRRSSLQQQQPPPPPASDGLAPLPPAAATTSVMPGSFDEAGWGSAAAAGAGPGGLERSGTTASRMSGGGGVTGEQLPAYGEGDDEAEKANAEAERILARERESKTASRSSLQ